IVGRSAAAFGAAQLSGERGIAMKHKHLAFGFEIKAVEDDGLFSGYLAVFDEVDAYHEVIKQGAFKKSLAAWKKKKMMPPILWQHDTAQPIGVYTEMRE